MPNFRDLNDLEEFIKDALDETVGGKVVEQIRERQLQIIETLVYRPYQPKIYQRRYQNQGLLDKENIKANKIGVARYSIVNVTKKKGVGDYLAPLIEYGHGVKDRYDYPRAGRYYMRARPFTAMTVEHFKQTDEHISTLKDGLKSKGFRIK